MGGGDNDIETRRRIQGREKRQSHIWRVVARREREGEEKGRKDNRVEAIEPLRREARLRARLEGAKAAAQRRGGQGTCEHA